MAVYRKPPAPPGRPPAPAMLAYRPEQLTRAPVGHPGFAAFLAACATGLAFAAADLRAATLPAMVVAGITTWVARRRDLARPRATFRVRGERVEVVLGDGETLVDERLEDVLDIRLDTKTVERIIEHPDRVPVPITQATVAPPVEESRIEIVTRSRVVPLTPERFTHSDSLEWRGKMRQFLRKNGWEPDHEREGHVAAESAGERRDDVEPAGPRRAPPRRITGWLWLWPVALVVYPFVTMRQGYAAMHAFAPALHGSAWWAAERFDPMLAVRMAVAATMAIVRIGLLLLVAEATWRKLAVTRKLVYALCVSTLVEGAVLALLPARHALEVRLVLPYFAWALPWIAYFSWAQRPTATFAEPGLPKMWLQAGSLAAVLMATFAVRATAAPGPVESLPRAPEGGALLVSPMDVVTARIVASPQYLALFRELAVAGEDDDAIGAKVNAKLAERSVRGFGRLDQATLERLIRLELAIVERVDVSICAEAARGGPGASRFVYDGLRLEDADTYAEVALAAYDAGSASEELGPANPGGFSLVLNAVPAADRERAAAALRGDGTQADLCAAQRQLFEAALQVEPSRKLEAYRWVVTKR